MEEKTEKPVVISYYDHEAQIARAEAHSKRWAIAALIAFLALILSKAGWIVYESQFEDVTTTVSQEASSEGGGDAVINGDRAGAVFYGESEANNNSEEESQEDGR